MVSMILGIECRESIIKKTDIADIMPPIITTKGTIRNSIKGAQAEDIFKSIENAIRGLILKQNQVIKFNGISAQKRFVKIQRIILD